MDEDRVRSLFNFFGPKGKENRIMLEKSISEKLSKYGYSIAKYGLILENADNEKAIADIRFGEGKIVLSKHEKTKRLRDLLEKESIPYREFGYWFNGRP